MPRIVGVDVPNNKQAWIALTYIHGVGVHRSKKILAEIGVDASLRASKLSEDEVSRIAQIIGREYDIAVECRFVASRPRVTPEPARVKRRPLPARRASRNCVNCFPVAA